MPLDLPRELIGDRLVGPLRRAAEDAGDVVAELPDPGDLEIMQAGDQAETPQPDQVADVDDVGLKLLERGRQDDGRCRH